MNTKTIDKKFAGFEIQIEVKDKKELSNIMQKVRGMKLTTSCRRNINDKLDDPNLKNYALDMKLFIEEMREQTQNVE